jgi:hypothetical protein
LGDMRAVPEGSGHVYQIFVLCSRKGQGGQLTPGIVVPSRAMT